MQGILVRATALAILLSLGTGCAQSPHRAFSGDRDAVKTTDVVVLAAQDGLVAEYTPSNIAQATGGGLIPALIDMFINQSRESDAHGAVAPLEKHIADIPFNQGFTTQLNRALADLAWLGTRPASVRQDARSLKLDAALKHSEAGAVLFVPVSYRFSEDFSSFKLESTPWLSARSARLRKSLAKAGIKASPDSADRTDAAYFNTLLVTITADGAREGDPDHNLALWSADDAARLRQSMTDGPAQLAQLIAADLCHDAAPSLANCPTAITRLLPGGNGERIEDGTLQYFAVATANPAAPLAAAPQATGIPQPAGTPPAAASPPMSEAATDAPADAPAAAAPQPATASAPAASPAVGTMSLAADTPLMDRPTADAKPLGSLAAGTVVVELTRMSNSVGRWVFVRAESGLRGWIRSQP